MAKPIKKSSKKSIVMDKDNTQFTQDSFSNFMYKLGMGADNPLSSATYSLTTLISRNRALLEAGYRSSWLIGQAVDTVAEDMTKMGIKMMSDISPDDITKLQVGLNDYDVWESYCNIIKWARLYGGALGVILIDGADYSKPLNLEAIGKNTFKGILVLDRWMCEPLVGELITDLDKDFGKPKYYRINTSVANAKIPLIKIHYSRVMRFDGITLPFYQKIYENHWGLSVVERIYDRLISYDSATLGASQLMYKAFLRTIGVKGLREAFMLGGKTENAIIKQFEYIRKMQSNEGITLIDSEDSFDIKTNSFGGVAELLQEFGQQISGATGIPLVRLFGQSPAGFSTGETDLRNYYDNVHREQENKLRPQLSKLLEVMSLSVLGRKLPEDFEYTFNSLWQMSDKEKSEIATSDSGAVSNVYGAGLISKESALKELLQSSRVTGRFSNIDDSDLEKAREEDANQPPPGMGPEENRPPVEDQPMDQPMDEPMDEQPIDELPEETKELDAPKSADPLFSIVKPLKEVVSPNILKNNSIITNVQSAIKENVRAAARAIYQKFFSKDAEEYNYHTVWKKFKEYANSKGFTQKVAGDEAFTNKKGQICRYKSSKYGKDITVYEEGVGVHTIDAEFKESEHPRGNPKNAGQFTSGGGNVKKTEISKSSAKKEDESVSGSVNAKEIREQAKMQREAEKKSGSSINFVKMDKIDTAKQKTINKHKLNEENIKDVLSFDGYDVEAFYDFPKKMPGVTYVIVTAVGKEETATKGKQRNVIETTFSVDEDRPDEVHLDFMEVYSGKNKGIAKDYIKRIEDYVKKTGKKKITLLADISIGRYAWAKLGFKADAETVERLKRRLIEHASGVLKMKYGTTPEYSEKRGEMLKKIKTIKDVEEIADFDFPDTEYTAQELKESKQLKYYNPDVPLDMKMKVGKSFLTNNHMSLETDWHGTREVGSTKDSLGAMMFGELETKDEENAEPKRLLLFTNKERGVKEGETDYEFHKEILIGKE